MTLSKPIFLVISLLIFTIIFHFSEAGDRKWRALALSGGGDKGSYQASVFIELVNLLGEEAHYDVVTGVSAGSMNACGLGIFAAEEAEQASEYIYSLWNSIAEGDVYQMWPGGVVEGIYEKSGILDSKPLLDFVTKEINGRPVRKKVTFAACEANSGDYAMFDYNATDTFSDFYVHSAIGSSSIPLIFPNVQHDGKVYVDGGSIWNIDIPSAVRRCKEIVDDDADIIVDMVLWGSNPPVSEPIGNLKDYSALSHYERSLDIKSFYDTMNKVERAKSLFPEVDFRYFISPSESLSIVKISLDFSKAHIEKWFDIGKKDARAAVKLGSGKYFEIVKEYKNKIINGERPNLSLMIDEAVAKLDHDNIKFEST